MKELQKLQAELMLFNDNIERMIEFRKEELKADHRYIQCQSAVVGEFKHRIIALKQRLTLASKITTSEFLRK